MGKWKKWLSAGLFTAMLGTAIIAGPTADVSANADLKKRRENLQQNNL